MKLRLFILFAFTSLFAKAAKGADTTPASFYTITTFEGLPSNTIGAIKKDSLGFIWIGTKQGLCRFDGCEIKTYPSFAEDDIWSIEELDGEILLIGTISNLKYFNRKTGSVSVLDIPVTTVKAIRKVGAGRFLAATDIGLYLISGGKAQRIFFDTGLSPSNHITSILAEDKDTYWYTTADGLGRLDLKSLKTSVYRADPTVTNTNFFTSLTQVGNRIYLGSFNKGVFRFDIRTKQFSTVKGFDHDLVMTMDSHDSLVYVGTNGKGLKILSLRDGQIYYKEKKKHSIGSNTITSFLFENGILWVGTQFGGLSYTPSVSEKFSYYQKGGFYSTDYNIRSFYFTEKGNKLIGTRTGLFYISEKDNSVRSFLYKDNTSPLRSDIIPAIVKLNGRILVCTYGGGVYVFDENTQSLKDFSPEELFRYGCFFHATQDNEGNMWFGSTDGLIKCSPKGEVLKRYDTTNSGLTNNIILYLRADSMHRLWIGTHFGLFLMDISTGKIRSDCFQSPINSLVRYIAEDSQKNTWVCTESGLYGIQPDLRIRVHYSKENLLPENKVVSFQEDTQGNYWIATSREITKYNAKEKTSYTYRRSDGLNGYDFNNQVFLAGDGTLWWPNESGLIYALKEKVHTVTPAKQAPRVTSYFVSGVEHDPVYGTQAGKIVLPQSNNSLRFRFSNMDYSLPYATVYEYQLEGHDPAWIRQTGINEVTYTHLPPGNYTFTLRAPGSKDQLQQFQVQVQRSYTFFAGILLVLVVIGTLVTYFTRRIWKLKRHMKDERMILDSVLEKRKSPKTENLPSDPKTKELLDELLRYMEEGKPYLNPKLSISDLASKLRCTEAELSQFLNNYMKVNFANFINIYRINEIKLWLNKENLSKYTLKTLSEQCGFNSKTTFYRVFKDVTGMTPSEYCKSLNLKIAEK